MSPSRLFSRILLAPLSLYTTPSGSFNTIRYAPRWQTRGFYAMTSSTYVAYQYRDPRSCSRWKTINLGTRLTLMEYFFQHLHFDFHDTDHLVCLPSWYSPTPSSTVLFPPVIQTSSWAENHLHGWLYKHLRLNYDIHSKVKSSLTLIVHGTIISWSGAGTMSPLLCQKTVETG